MLLVATSETGDGHPDTPSDIDAHLARLRIASERLRETHLRFAAALDEFLETSAAYLTMHASIARTGSEVRTSLTPVVSGVAPTLSITCFGRFEVRRSQQRVPPCSNRNGQTILRYLAAQPRHREHGDVLMDVLWPDDPPDVARHKLHCAVSALRGSLNARVFPRKRAGYLVHEDQTYGLADPALVDIDADQLLAGYAAGLRLGGGERAMAHFEAACRLYAGTFLPEDLYAEWSQIRRQQLSQTYVSMCSSLSDQSRVMGRCEAAADWALRILEENRCDESAYRQLMRAYAAQGRRSEAMRQFRRCETVLDEELGVGPMAETRELFDSIARGEVAG